jgi:hypothetical protein
MMPSFPVAGLMLAAEFGAAGGVDMLGGTLLWSEFPFDSDTSVSRSEKGGANWRLIEIARFYR